MTKADRLDARRLPLSALLLCGGEARRFGCEKGLASFRGRPLAECILPALDSLSDDVRISTNCPDLYRPLGRPIVQDIHQGSGPLGGLHAGLTAARHDLLAVVACDMPFASPDLFLHLLEISEGYDVVVPIYREVRMPPGAKAPGKDRAPRGPRYQALHALYRRSCLPAIESALAGGEKKMSLFYRRVKVREVPEKEWRPLPGVDPRVFENINTPEDLRRLEIAPGTQ